MVYVALSKPAPWDHFSVMMTRCGFQGVFGSMHKGSLREPGVVLEHSGGRRRGYTATRREAQMQSSQYEYRVMNPMYRILKEYTHHEHAYDAERSSTEVARPLSILVMDEGGEIRSRLAGAMLVYMLKGVSGVQVDVASLGPPVGVHDVASNGAAERQQRLLERMVMLWMKNDSEALAMVRRVPRQFQEVKDPVSYDLMLVMDSYDLQEAMREVSVLDAMSPGYMYSSRVKMIAPFAGHVQGSRDRPLPGDIPDPLYIFQSISTGQYRSKDRHAAELHALSRELAYCCKGVVDMLAGIEEYIGSQSNINSKNRMKSREVLQQILRCPGLWMEHPYGPVPRKYWVAPQYHVRRVHGKKVIVKRMSKERGYWKVFENVQKEVEQWMEGHGTETLPTQAMLRASGAHSLASAIDAHGGLSVFASILGVKLHKRRPNGFWSNSDALKREIQAYIVEGSRGMMMPTAQELVQAGRSDLVRAIRMHGGFSKVALLMGIEPHRSGHHWEEVEILNVLQHLKDEGRDISRSTIREMTDMPGLESAIDRLGGFPYFMNLLDDNNESCQLYLTESMKRRGIDDVWSYDGPVCEQLQCPKPYIEKVAKKVVSWIHVVGLSRLPTRKELEVHDRLDLWRCIQRAGGLQKLAEYLDMDYVETRGRKTASGSVQSKANNNDYEKNNNLNAYHEFVLID
jgi:hypothetical protein